MKLVILLLSLFLVDSSLATQVAPKLLHELVTSADHVIEGKIIDVVIRNGSGVNVADDNAATGPGISNQIFLKVQLAEGDFVHSKNPKLPNIIWIPLWQMWHDTLGNRKKQIGASYVFLLKGDRFDPVYPANYDRNLSDLPKIKKLIEEAQAATSNGDKPSN